MVYIGEKFVVVRLLDLKDLFSGKPLNGYCVTVLYADLETGRAAMR